MKKVCLKTGLSYVAKGISCRKGKVVEVEDDVAARLLKTGRFEIMGMESVVPEFVDLAPESLAPESPAPESPAPAGTHTNITSMKKDELIAFAEEQGIDVVDCKNNEERIQRIQSEMNIKAFARLASEE